ncbi:hypothetical protein BaRGS_00022945 [Batillaria attramentaria]|uniref:Uncharacterized protein n=1 Tax=Batillaria attramentaria TaxID=370345 RepID=A0ABD0KFS0_9CAEN
MSARKGDYTMHGRQPHTHNSFFFFAELYNTAMSAHKGDHALHGRQPHTCEEADFERVTLVLAMHAQSRKESNRLALLWSQQTIAAWV